MGECIDTVVTVAPPAVAATGTEQPVRWVTAAVLLALARLAPTAGKEFTAVQLAARTAGQLSDAQRVNATTRLCFLGFVRHRVGYVANDRADLYTVTPEGAAAIAAASAGQVRKSGPRPGRAQNPVKPASLTARLWKLLCMRQMLDAESAARVLCDAGDAAVFKRTQASIARTLRRWGQAGTVAESRCRVGAVGTSNGFIRYVLQVEPGPTPPRWRQIVRAQAAQAEAGAPQGAQA